MTDETPVEPAPSDPHRRRFFRLFAGDVATSVGSMLGAARSLQAETTSAAQELLGVAMPAAAPAPVLPAARTQGPYLANTAGYRAPFRFEDGAVFIWDQRQLPDILAEMEIAGAADAVSAMTDGAILGAAVQAQFAAAVLALVAERAWDARPFARRATIRGSANALRTNRLASAQLAFALERLLAIQDDLPLEVDGKVLGDAFRREAEEIIVEATEDHGKIAEHAIEALPGGPDAPLHVLTLGSTGAMGSGVFGTALGVITARHHAGQPIHALVAESRPWLTGSRIACWELAQAGVGHAVVTDAAAPGCIAAGEVEAVLVTADRIAANGDCAAAVGAYALALAAKASDVPFLVTVATSAIDDAIPDLDELTVEEARPATVVTINGKRIAPEGVHIRNPVTDVIPADLITAYITDEGVLRPPFAESIAAALERSSQRRSAARGYRAMLEQRRKAAAEAAGEAPEIAAAQAERQAAIRDMASGMVAPVPAPAPHEEEPVPADADAETSVEEADAGAADSEAAESEAAEAPEPAPGTAPE
jgi:methylthioribose-1-phosphate isomerase